MRALIIEDNIKISQIIAKTLLDAGLVSDICGTAGDGQSALTDIAYDVVVLDLGLPDQDGLEVLRQVRKSGNTVPVLILTARSDISERVEGLDGGADDYLTKPFAQDELAARVRALLRRPGGTLGVELVAGNIVLNTADRSVSISDQPVVVSRRETDLLEILMRRVGRVVPKSAIEDSLYEFGAEVASNSVEVCIHRLRRNLEKGGANSAVHTVRGVGYLLVDETTE
jgi:DNA-binding response OmpR family regulator